MPDTIGTCFLLPARGMWLVGAGACSNGLRAQAFLVPWSAMASVPAEHATLYQRVLDSEWERLHPTLQALRGAQPLHARGSFRIGHGETRWSRLAAWCLRVPRACEAAEVVLRVTPVRDCEHWHRTFNGHPLATAQRMRSPGWLDEQVWCLRFTFRLLVEGDALVFQHSSTALAAGRLQVRLPRFMAPSVNARESAVAAGPEALGASSTTRARVSVRVAHPWVGTFLTYDGIIAAALPMEGQQ